MRSPYAWPSLNVVPGVVETCRSSEDARQVFRRFGCVITLVPIRNGGTLDPDFIPALTDTRWSGDSDRMNAGNSERSSDMDRVRFVALPPLNTRRTGARCTAIFSAMSAAWLNT